MVRERIEDGIDFRIIIRLAHFFSWRSLLVYLNQTFVTLFLGKDNGGFKNLIPQDLICMKVMRVIVKNPVSAVKRTL